MIKLTKEECARINNFISYSSTDVEELCHNIFDEQVTAEILAYSSKNPASKKGAYDEAHYKIIIRITNAIIDMRNSAIIFNIATNMEFINNLVLNTLKMSCDNNSLNLHLIKERLLTINDSIEITILPKDIGIIITFNEKVYVGVVVNKILVRTQDHKGAIHSTLNCLNPTPNIRSCIYPNNPGYYAQQPPVPPMGSNTSHWSQQPWVYNNNTQSPSDDIMSSTLVEILQHII